MNAAGFFLWQGYLHKALQYTHEADFITENMPIDGIAVY